jgi:hypothetical protein
LSHLEMVLRRLEERTIFSTLKTAKEEFKDL